MAADSELNVELVPDPELCKLLDHFPTKQPKAPGSKRKLFHERAEKASKKTRAEAEKLHEEASSSSSASSKAVAAAEATRILNEQKFQNRRAQGVAGALGPGAASVAGPRPAPRRPQGGLAWRRRGRPTGGRTLRNGGAGPRTKAERLCCVCCVWYVWWS